MPLSKRDQELLNKYIPLRHQIPQIRLKKPDTSLINPSTTATSLRAPRSLTKSDQDLLDQHIPLRHQLPQVKVPKLLPSLTEKAQQVVTEDLLTSPFFTMEKMDLPPTFTQDIAKHLESIYYEPSHHASFSSPRKLYLAARKKFPFLTQQQVQKWLARQRTYALTRAVYRNFPRRKVLVRGLGYQYQADLLDMTIKKKDEEHDDDKNRDFILTVIDCFSRFAQAVPVKSKSGPHVLQGLIKVFQKMQIPKKLQTDLGPEFYNKWTQDLFAKLGIIHFSTMQELKAQIVERFNRTLRAKINRYKVANATLHYHEALPDLIFAYNSSPHSSIGYYAPKDVTLKNEHLIRQIQYGPYLLETLQKPNFKIGDVVRIARPKHGLKKLPTTFTRKLFVITDILNTSPITYRLMFRESKEAVDGTYYEHQLQKL